MTIDEVDLQSGKSAYFDWRHDERLHLTPNHENKWLLGYAGSAPLATLKRLPDGDYALSGDGPAAQTGSDWRALVIAVLPR